MSQANLEINKEMHICRFGSGIKLIRPGLIKSRGVPTVGSILNLPVPVYFEDNQHVTLSGNEICAEECGFASFSDFMKMRWFTPFRKNTIQQTLANDEKVVENNQHIIVEEITIREDDVNLHTLSVRMPWYAQDNKIAGLFGCTILLNKNPLAESLALISSLGLLNAPSTTLYKSVDGYDLSKRESECLSLTVRGYSAREAGLILGLSQRTIEEYINNIKLKLGATSKAELIDMAVHNYIQEEDT